MKNFILIFVIVLLYNCGRPLYIKDKNFNCKTVNYIQDNDLKKVVFKVLKRAVIIDKDIPDYRLIWDKSKIYISDRFRTEVDKEFSGFQSQTHSYLNFGDIPNKIMNVNFCLKSEKELQKIADKSKESFLYLKFELIEFRHNTATITIRNSWKIHKNSKKIMLSGGSYTCIYKKINEEWIFDKITKRTIS